MERLRREKERAVVQTYGLVSGHGRDVNDADDFWEEERRRGPQKPSAAERQSQVMAMSLTQLLSVSFQEKAQSLQRSELDAFLFGTLKESPGFSTASPTALESAVEYLKQILGTLHGLDVCPSSNDVQAQADQGATPSPTAPGKAAPGDQKHRSAPAARPIGAPMQSPGAQQQDAPQAGSASPSGTAAGSEPSLNPVHSPDHSAHEQQQQQQRDLHGTLQDAGSASFDQSPAHASSTGQLQQLQQQQQQGLSYQGHHTPGPWAQPAMPYNPPTMQAGHAMDPYNAFLSAAASAASAAAAAFAGSWARPPGSNPSVSPPSSFSTYPAAHHTSPSSNPQALNAQWPQQPAQQRQQQQQWAQHPRHVRSHRRGTNTNGNLRGNDHAGGGEFGEVQVTGYSNEGLGEVGKRRARRGSGSDGSSSLEGRSSPEPEPQALDARMASAAAHMMHGGNFSTAASGAAAQVDGAEQHNPFPSATTVRVVKHDDGPRIKARVPPSGPIELRPPHFQVFRNLQPPAIGTQQPLPLPQQHPLPPPSPYSSPPISPPRSPPLPAVNPSPRARVAAQLTPTPAPSRARVPLPHHHPKPGAPAHSLAPPSRSQPARNSDSEQQQSSPAPVPDGPPQAPPYLNTKPATATTYPQNTRSSVPNPGHVPRTLHAASAPSMPGTHIAAPTSPQQPAALHYHHAPAQHAGSQGQYGSSLQFPDVLNQLSTHSPAHPPAAVQPVHLPPQPPLPPRQPVPLPSELQGSVQRTLEFLENPLSFAPGATSDVGGSSYPPRVSFATAEQQAAQRALEEQLGGRFDYKLLVADLEAMHRRTQRLPTTSAVAPSAAAISASTDTAPTHAHQPVIPASAPQADRSIAGGAAGLKNGSSRAASAAKAAANAQARGGAALGKLVQHGAQRAKGSQLAGAQPPATQGSSLLPNVISAPATHAPPGNGALAEGDIVEALPPSNSVWDSEEAWRDMDAYMQSIQQEVAYRASAPAPPPSKHTPTPQELDAAVAARLHRPHPSAARAAAAAAAAASNTTAGAANTVQKGGKKGGEAEGVSAQRQQQRLQQRRRQQAATETSGGDEARHTLPAAAGPPHSSVRTPRLTSPPIRPRPPPPKIAFGRRADGPPLPSTTVTGTGGLGPKAPAAATKERALPVHDQKASPTHLTRTGAAAAAARHATHTTPPRVSPPQPTAPLFDSRTSTASKLSALLKAHAQHAQQNRRQGENVTPSRHHHTRPGHTDRAGVGERHRHSRHNHHGRHKRGSSDSSLSSAGSSSDSAASLNTSSRTGSGSSSAVGGSGADLEDVLSVLASVLAEEEGPEAQEALMAEVLEALQAAGQGIPGLGHPGTDMAHAAGGGREGSREAPNGESLSGQQHQQQRQGGSGWAATQELAQQLAALAAEQRQQQQQHYQQQKHRDSGARAGAPVPRHEPLQPTPLPTAVPHMPGFVAVQDLSVPPSADPGRPTPYSTSQSPYQHLPNQMHQAPQQLPQQQLQQWARTPQLMQQQHAQTIAQQQQQQGVMTTMPLLSVAHPQPQPPQQYQPWPSQPAPPPTYSVSPVLGQPQYQQQLSAHRAAPYAPPRAPWQSSWIGGGVPGEGADDDDGAAAAVSATMPPPYTRSAAMLGLYGDAAHLGATGHAPAHAGAATMLHDYTQGGMTTAQQWQPGMQAGLDGSTGSPTEALLDLVVEEVAAQVAVRERSQGPSVLSTQQQQQQQQQEVVRTMPLLTDPQVSRQLASEVVLEHLSKLLAPISTEEEQQRQQEQRQQQQQQLQQHPEIAPLPATHATFGQPPSATSAAAASVQDPLHPHTGAPLAQAPALLQAAQGPSLTPAAARTAQPAVVHVSSAAGGVGSDGVAAGTAQPSVVSVSGAAGGLGSDGVAAGTAQPSVVSMSGAAGGVSGTPGGGVAGAFYGAVDGLRHGPGGALASPAYGPPAHGRMGAGVEGDGGQGVGDFPDPLTALEASGLEAREAGRAALAAAAAAAAAALPSPPKEQQQQQQQQHSQQGQGQQHQEGQQLEGQEQGLTQGQQQQQGQHQESQDHQQQLEGQEQGQVQGQEQRAEPALGASTAAHPPGAATAAGGDRHAATPLHRPLPLSPSPGLTTAHDPATEGKAHEAATEASTAAAAATKHAHAGPALNAQAPTPLQQRQQPSMHAHAGPALDAPATAAAPAPAAAAAHPSAVAVVGSAATEGGPQQPQPPPHPAIGGGPVLTMQVPIPIPTPYPAYYTPSTFTPSPAWPGFTPPTPHQHHQNQQQPSPGASSSHLGSMPAGHPSQSHPLLQPHFQPSPTPLDPAGAHYQEPPQLSQPDPAWAARARRHAGGGVGGAVGRGGGGSAARGRLSSLLPGLERVLLDSSDLGSSGDSDALEDAVRAALHARTGHTRAAGDGSEPNNAADPLRLLRESYSEVSLEALLAAVPRARPGASQAQAQDQLQHDAQQQQQQQQQQQRHKQQQQQQQQQRHKQQVDPNVPLAKPVLDTEKQDQGAQSAPEEEGAQGPGAQDVRGSSGGGSKDEVASEATAAAMQVAQQGSSSGSKGGSTGEADTGSGDLGLEAARLAGTMGQRDDEGEDDGEIEEMEVEGEEWKRPSPASAYGGVNLAEQQQQQDQSERCLPVLAPQAPAAPVPSPSGEAGPKAAETETLAQAGQAAGPSQAQRLAVQDLPSKEQPNLARPADAATAPPQGPLPASGINLPPAPPLQAPPGASIGLPPSLHDYSGPLRRLWRPSQGPAPHNPQQLAGSSSLGPNAHPTQGYTKDDASAQDLTGGGSAALDLAPPLHASSPPSSLQSSGEALRLSSSDATTASTSTNTGTTSSSSSTAGGLAARELPRPANMAPLAEGDPGRAAPQQQPHVPGTSSSKMGASYRVVMRRYGAKRREMMRQLGLIGDSLLASSRSSGKHNSGSSTSSESGSNEGSSSGSDSS